MADYRIVILRGPFETETRDRLVDDLLADIRPCDMRDIDVTGNARLVVELSIDDTEELVVVRDEDGSLLFLAGVCKQHNDLFGRYVWMLGCNKVYQYKKSLLYQFCKRKCREWAIKHQLLIEAVHPENTTTIEWLQRVCGAKFLDDVMTINGVDFRKCFITGGGI